MGKIGIIDVGGGMRGAYPAGALEFFAENKIKFDVCIGVSAGALNLSSFIANQRGRNLRFYTKHPFTGEYMNPENVQKKGCVIDLDYFYKVLSNEGGEDPLDYDELIKNPAEFIIVATDAVTGEAVYFTKNDLARNDYSPLAASSAIPAMCKPGIVGQRVYFDGALADSIPVDKAFELGCDKVVLMLTRPINSVRKVGDDIKLASMIKDKFPAAADKMEHRADLYNALMDKVRGYVQEGRVLILAPQDTYGVSTVTTDIVALERLYQSGYDDAYKMIQSGEAVFLS